MKLGPHGTFLVKFVTSFVQDELARWAFDLDYSGYVLEHFPGFEAETPRLATKFATTVDHTYEGCARMDDKAHLRGRCLMNWTSSSARVKCRIFIN